MRAPAAVRHGRERRSLRLWALVVLVAASGGCARRYPTATPRYASPSSSRPTSAAPATSAPSELAGHGTADDPFLLCHGGGGPDRTDYPFVASWHCADGSVPLGGDAMSGAGSRVGNVGPGPDGHIVDLYRVPCPSGPVDLYVDAYHCGAGVDADVDLANLTAAQLAHVAEAIRELHHDPSSMEAFEMRRFFLQWLLETPQVSVVVCETLVPLLPEDPPRPYAVELMLALAASVIEDGRDPVDPVRANLAAFAGLVTYYQAALAEDPSIRDARMDQLAAMLASGALRAEVATRISGCDLSHMGVHFVHP